MKFLQTIVSILSYIFTAIRLVVLCIKIKKISIINDKIQADKEISDAIKKNDTKKIAQFINFYRNKYDKEL